jgi:putative addiction module killer protein
MPETFKHTLVHYTDGAGVDLFGQWLDALADMGTRATIAARLVRLELGLFGDSKTLGDGVSELRIDHGPGWRVYYGRQAGRVILLVAGSDKSGQKEAIKTARKRLENWNQRGMQ